MWAAASEPAAPVRRSSKPIGGGSARESQSSRPSLKRSVAPSGMQASQRQAVPLSTVGSVGYTNAGKSTIFNRLTGAAVLADANVATLDTVVRQIRLPSQRRVLLSDTGEFIRNLPTTLVDAFRPHSKMTAAAFAVTRRRRDFAHRIGRTTQS